MQKVQLSIFFLMVVTGIVLVMGLTCGQDDPVDTPSVSTSSTSSVDTSDSNDNSSSTESSDDPLELGSVTNVSISQVEGKPELSWTNPSAADFDHVTIIRKADSEPTDISDGTEAYTGSDESYTDEDSLSEGLIYYSLFSCAENDTCTDTGESVSLLLDTTAPVISDFTITSANPSTSKSITFDVTASDANGIAGYYLKETRTISTLPELDDSAWTGTKPTGHEFSCDAKIYGPKYLCLLVKDETGNISEEAMVELTYHPANEDVENWNLVFDGNGGNDSINAVAVDSLNNVYVLGEGENLVSASSGTDWWIKKFDSNGNEDTSNWDKKFDGSGGDDIGYDLAIDSSDNVYAAGWGENLVSGSSQDDLWLKKFTSAGTEDVANWNLKFDGNNDADRIYAVEIDSNDNVYIAGFGTNLVSGSSEKDWWIKKFNISGVEDTSSWDKQIDGNGDFDEITDLAIDSTDKIYLTGIGTSIASGSLDADWWMKKFDSDGNEDTTNWNKIYHEVPGGFFGCCEDDSYCITKDSTDNIYVSGWSDGVHIKKFTADGNEDTTNWTSGPDSDAMVCDSSDNLFVVDYIPLLYISKFDSNKNEDTTTWDLSFSYIKMEESSNTIALDSNDNLYIGGYGENLISATSGTDWWIKKFTP